MLNPSQFMFLIVLFAGSDSAKILGVFPTPSISHQAVFRPLMLELAKREHEVTVITPDPAFPKGNTPPNLKEIDVHDISYGYINTFLSKKQNKTGLDLIKSIIEFFSDIFKLQLESDVVKEFIKNDTHFDLLFTEACIRPAVIFSHIYKVPVIKFSSLGGLFSAYEDIGAASHPIVYPDAMHRRIYDLTLWEKVTEVYYHYETQRIYRNNVDSEMAMLKTIFGSDIPDLRDIEKQNVHMLFLNVHQIWDFNRPVPPNVIYLGGLHQKPGQNLPKELESYLNNSMYGVIYMSFGSNIRPSLLPPEKIKVFTNVFADLPFDVLWKWDEDELPERPKNVRISKWLPQSDLLRHPNIKLFITQGGLQSTDEAITAGVPLIGIPMNGDQWFNVEQYVKFKIGVRLSMETLTEEKLKNAIEVAYRSDRYRENISKLRNRMNDQPQSALERAVWWTEYVIRHGGAIHLRTPAAYLTWVEYYEIYYYIALTCVLLIIFIGWKIRYYLNKKVKLN